MFAFSGHDSCWLNLVGLIEVFGVEMGVIRHLVRILRLGNLKISYGFFLTLLTLSNFNVLKEVVMFQLAHTIAQRFFDCTTK